MPLLVTVTPGVTISEDTVLTAEELNLLGTPTVDIRGTVDGTSGVTVADGSVTNAKLADMTGPKVKGRETGTGAPQDLAIDSTLDIASTILKVKDAGIGPTQLASSAVTTAKIADQNVTFTKLTTLSTLQLLGNASSAAASPPEPISLGSGLSVSGNTDIATATRSRTSNVATITTGSAHGLSSGYAVNVTGMTDTSFNAYNVTITVVNSTTFTYASTGSNVSSGADTGGKVRRYGVASLNAPNVVVASTSYANSNTQATVTDIFDGAGAVPTWGPESGARFRTFKSALATEFTASITPKSATNILIVEVSVPVFATGGCNAYLALFRDPSVDADTAVAVAAQYTGDQAPGVAKLTYSVVAGSTSQTTFKLKYAQSANTAYFNGYAAYPAYLCQAVMKITEVPA